MDSGFLYRRLAAFMPCVLKAVGQGTLPLGSKYEVASLRDVFLSAQYWRLFDYIKTPPKLIVDLGAHCGHFSILMHLMQMEKFHQDESHYVLVEPVDTLIEIIKQRLADVGIQGRADIHSGLIGESEGEASMKIVNNNLLVSQVDSAESGAEKPYLNPLSIIRADSLIDVLKVDVEGGEYGLFENFPDVFSRTRVLTIELHGEAKKQQDLVDKLSGLGLQEVSQRITYQEASMGVFVNTSL